MIIDPNRIYDGFSSLAGGQDAGKRPSLIGEDQCASLENAVCRGGKPATRSGFKHLSWNYKNPTQSYNEAGLLAPSDVIYPQYKASVIFPSGLFQEAIYYNPPSREACFMVTIGGRLFKVVPKNTTADVTEIPIPVRRNRNNIPLNYMVQADRFHITQDGESSPIIFDGVTARRSSTNEVPTGNQMAYGMGRLVVLRAGPRDILFGDLYGSHAGPDPGASVLLFTETTFLAEGGSATIPFSLGEFRAPIFYPQQDTVSGQGELLVFAEKGMASFFMSLPRQQWKESNFQRLGLLEIGGRGHRAFTAINEDIWFRSGDGWRSYRQARAEWKGFAQIPLSTEVRPYVDADTPSLLLYASAIHFQNRLIATCTPVPNQGRLYHEGFVVLDFDVLSTFGQSTKPAWDGHWSNLRTFKLVSGTFNGVERAFAFGLDDDNHNALYEITIDDVEDYNGPITSELISRSMNFGEPFNEDEIYGGDIWVDNVRAETDIEVFYKPDQYPEWLAWQPSEDGSCALDIVSKIGTCGEITCGMCPTVRRGFSPRIKLKKPDTQCDATTSRNTRLGYEHQVKIRWTGNMAINQLRIANQKLVENPKASK